MPFYDRKHPAHLPAHEWHNTPVIVFVTVCTKGRKPILANVAAQSALVDAWEVAHEWSVGRYVIMPDHVHLFCAPTEADAAPLIHWISYWKSHAARHWSSPNDAPIWQRHFWDRQLRRGESYGEKWDYVLANPVRAGLIARAEEWAFKGELNELRW